MSSAPFYVGDEWILAIAATDPQSGDPVVPGEVKVLVYSPAALAKPPTAEPVEAEVQGTGTGLYETVAVELSEHGIWRAIVSSTAPFKALQPTLITVQEPAAY